MKYYLIAGEASGDLHASHLMASLREQDPQAEFRFFGGDLMAAQGGTQVCHYRHLAYMGFLPVLFHLRTILRGLRQCQADILQWQPDVLVLVDYPGFNMKVARFVRKHTSIPIVYYISPKIWAWKEHRIRAIRRDVDLLLSILPFEVPYYRDKHHYTVQYVGNPTLDEVTAYTGDYPADFATFSRQNGLDDRPILALLAGSRKQEIQANLPRMVQAVIPLSSRYQLVVAAAPGIPDEQYAKWLNATPIHLLRNQTYPLLQHATAALVTSGTATLETALFRVPQVVCYYMRAGRLVTWGRRLFLKVPFISLVNLIADKEVVPELVADGMNLSNLTTHLDAILPGGTGRQDQLQGYEEVAQKLGQPGAPTRAAQSILNLIANRK